MDHLHTSHHQNKKNEDAKIQWGTTRCNPGGVTKFGLAFSQGVTTQVYYCILLGEGRGGGVTKFWLVLLLEGVTTRVRGLHLVVPHCTPPSTTIFAPFLIPVATVSSWSICTDPYPIIARPEVRHFIPFKALPLIDLKFNVRVNKVRSLCVRQESLCHAFGGRHFVPCYRTKVRREASGL